MKIAIITDIHGNAPALKTVLNEIDAQGDINEILCLGDMIGMGPLHNEVMEMLTNRSDVSMITGNHDEAVLALIDGEAYPESYAHAKVHHQWVADHLDRKFVEVLKELPRRIDRTYGDTKLTAIHYHIEDGRMDDPIASDPYYPIAEGTPAYLEEMFGEYEADVVCFGHHHSEQIVQKNHHLFVNPGALGCQKTDEAPYAILDLANGGRSLMIRRPTYDKAAFIELFEKYEVPSREILLKLFY